MILVWTGHAWDDVMFWAKNDKKVLARLIKLIDAIDDDPFAGLGKPEPLKGNLGGYWSRRINDEHRLVYKTDDGRIVIVQARYHY